MSLDRRSYDEKRGFIRMPVDCEVVLERIADGKRFTGAGRNLSASGLFFHTEEPLEPGERLEMHVEASKVLLSVLDATIEVVRVETAADGQSYGVGSAIQTIHEK